MKVSSQNPRSNSSVYYSAENFMALQITRPALAAGWQAVQYPSKVSVDAQALYQILSHSVRRKENQKRVIGTLMGTRSDDGNEVEVKSAYIVPISETEDTVNVNIEYHREMAYLIRRASPDYNILGWYATSPELNNLSALIHDLFSQPGSGTYPHPALHLTLDVVDGSLNVSTYVASAVGVPSDQSAGNCIFLPVRNVVEYMPVEQAALGVINAGASTHDRRAEILPLNAELENSLEELIDELTRVQHYVREVLTGSKPANVAVGKYLYRTLSLVPCLSSDKLYTSYFKDLLTIVSLTNTIKSQLRLSSELTALV